MAAGCIAPFCCIFSHFSMPTVLSYVGSFEFLRFWNKWEHYENKHHLLRISIFPKYRPYIPTGGIKSNLPWSISVTLQWRTEPSLANCCKCDESCHCARVGLTSLSVWTDFLRRTQPLVLRFPEAGEFQAWEKERVFLFSLCLLRQNEFHELSKLANECDQSRENNSYSWNFQQQRKIILLTRHPY